MSPMNYLKDSWVQILGFSVFISGLFSLISYTATPREISPTIIPAHVALAPKLEGQSPIFLSQPRQTILPQLAPAATRPALANSQTPLPLLKRHVGPWVVDASRAKGSDFQTISEALRNAHNGDVILIRPGIYQETLIISIPISLEGQGLSPSEVKIISSQPTTLSVVSGGLLSAKNLSIENSYDKTASALAISNAQVALSGINIKSRGEGIYLNEAFLSAEDSRLNAKIAIFAASSDNFNLKNCNIKADTEGISFFGSRITAKLVKVNFSGSGTGIRSEGNDIQITINGSKFNLSRSPGALIAYSNSHVEVNNSEVYLNNTSEVGFYARKSYLAVSNTLVQNSATSALVARKDSTIIVKHSRFNGNKACAIKVSGSSIIRLERSVIINNHCGIGFEGPASLNAIANKFINNGIGPLAVVPGIQNSLTLNGSKNIGLSLYSLKHPPTRFHPVHFDNDIFSPNNH